MAKVIGAEAHRNLQYALSREEEKEALRKSRSARQRTALANDLSGMANDPDIDDPNLALYGAAAQADPGGLVGGLAQAFGTIAKVKAQDKKREVVKERRKSDADSAVLQMSELYGEEKASGILESLDPDGEKRKDPRWVKNTMGMLKEREERDQTIKDRQLTDTKNALYLSKATQDITEQGLRISGLQDVQEEKEKERLQFERMAPALKKSLMELGADEHVAEMASKNPQFLTNYYNQEIATKISADKRRKMYRTDSFLRGLYPSEDAFVNAQNYKPEEVKYMMGKLSAQPMYQVAQSMKVNIAQNQNLLREAQPIARGNAINQLFPVVDQDNMPTQGFKEWYVNHAQTTLGIEPDDDDAPIDTQYADLLTQDAGGTVSDNMIAQRMATYQQELMMKDEDTEQKIAAMMGADERFGALLNNVSEGKAELQNVLQQYPAMRGRVMPEPVEFDDQIKRMGPGTIFTKTNGGVFITVGEGASVNNYGLSIDAEKHHHDRATGQKQSMTQAYGGAQSLDPTILKRGGVSYTPVEGGYNAGYRELTKAEMEGIMPSFTGQMDVPAILQQKTVGTDEYLNLLRQTINK